MCDLSIAILPVLSSLRLLSSRFYGAVAMLALLVVALMPQAVQAQSEPCVEEVVMQSGQSLAAIAANAFGTQDAVAELISATNAQAIVDASYTMIIDPNTVEAGWKICVPATSSDSLATLHSANGTRASMSSPVALEQDVALLETLLTERIGANGDSPLSIDYLRNQEYSTSSLTIVKLLSDENNYREYLVSYRSEGLTLYAVMAVPKGIKPATGWPVVIFVHGYVEPKSYNPTERYTAYVDAIASSGYIVLRPDLRGHSNSEGMGIGAYGDPGYTIDVLNGLAAIQQYTDADPNRIGMWGHSMGGYITSRVMVVNDAIQAGVIWAGVVAPYEEMVAVWDDAITSIADGELPIDSVLLNTYGSPQENPDLWSTFSATSYSASISGPVQLHHGTGDVEVPVYFSDLYYANLIEAGQTAEYYLYTGDDHNISANFDVAMRRTIDFLDTHVKNANLTLIVAQTDSDAILN